MGNGSIVQENRGFSLVELIVSILITSILSGIVVILISVSRNTYTAVNTETVIQTESEAVRNFIGELAREAKDYGFVDGLDASSTDKCIWFLGPDNTTSGYSPTLYYYFILFESDTNKLRYGRYPMEKDYGTGMTNNTDLTGSDGKFFSEGFSFKKLLVTNKTGVTATAIKGDAYSLLAEHVTNIECSSPETDNGLIRVDITLEYNGSTYTKKLVFAGRNRS